MTTPRLLKSAPLAGRPSEPAILVFDIAFTDDVQHIVDFLHQRSNVVPCPVCGTEVPVTRATRYSRCVTQEVLPAAGEETMSETARIFGVSDESEEFETTLAGSGHKPIVLGGTEIVALAAIGLAALDMIITRGKSREQIDTEIVNRDGIISPIWVTSNGRTLCTTRDPPIQ